MFHTLIEDWYNLYGFLHLVKLSKLYLSRWALYHRVVIQNKNIRDGA